jgi:hypothetical protein
MSFNYRARFSSTSSTLSHRIHHLLLLFGYRPSIPSRLREILLAPGPPPTLVELAKTFPPKLASPCYITFCSPDRILVIEKDLKTAIVHSRSDFLAVANHDQKMEDWSSDRWKTMLKKEGWPEVGGIREILEDSVERKELVAKFRRDDMKRRNLCVQDVKRWLTTKPILNEMTHFSCIMDPELEGGGLVWVRAYEDAYSDGGSSFGA